MAAGVEEPHTSYAKTENGDVHVAYQVVGDDSRALVLVADWMTPLEERWDLEVVASPLRRLSRFARVISLDKRGLGLSDPVRLDLAATPEEWVSDIHTVLDAVGVESAGIVGVNEGGPIGILFAATAPSERAL
jgi:pimeloyl-ACP methyl ester carboxylesterase